VSGSHHLAHLKHLGLQPVSETTAVELRLDSLSTKQTSSKQPQRVRTDRQERLSRSILSCALTTALACIVMTVFDSALTVTSSNENRTRYRNTIQTMQCYEDMA
jgi:hypothetical protein